MRGCLRTVNGRGRTQPGKKTLTDAFAKEIRQEVEALIGENAVESLDFEALETAVRRKALRVAARAVERRFNEDTSDHAGPSLPCRCGKQARYAGRRPKTFESVLGPLTLERAYYHCAACEAGFSPRDRALGLEGGSLSPAVTRMVGVVGARVSFKEGEMLLHDLAGVVVETKQVERVAEALGREIAKDEESVIEPATPGEVAPTMYLGMDGTGAPMRSSELEGRQGKQPDGSSKTREVKLCTVWSAEARDDYGAPTRDDGSTSYSAAIESAATRDVDEDPSDFARRVLREATRRGLDRAQHLVILGDGAPWIWNLAEEHFPDAVQIVDLFHVEKRLSDMGKGLYGPTSELGAVWAKKRQAELEAGETDRVLRALAAHASDDDDARKCFDYIKNNRHRMRYPEFRAMGFCTSTAVVEAGCNVAIGVRLKRPGMHWSVAGANDIIALRCCHLSGRYEDFWERRAARDVAAQ